MNRSFPPWTAVAAPRRAVRHAIRAGVLGLALLVPMAGAEAQSMPEADAYERAVERYERALEERAALLERYDRSVEGVSAARGGSEEGALEEAFASFFSRAWELQELDREVARAAEGVADARRAYLSVLDEREDQVLAALEGASDEAERAALSDLLVELRRETREVERDRTLEDEITLLPMPELSIDPRDGPTEILAKAGLLERRAEQYDSVAVEIDRRIDERQERLRRDRSLEDNLADLSRFDDVRLPVSRPQRQSQDVPDGMGIPEELDASLEGLTLEEEIAMLELFRERAEALRVRALAQARNFRERVDGVDT